MNRISPAVRIVAAVAVALLAACAEPQPPAAATPAAAAAPAPQPAPRSDAFGFRIGALEAFALKDGELAVPNDGATFGVGQPREQVAALLAAAAQPTDSLHLGIQPLLVRDGARVLLFDTGAGDAAFARAGRLPDALRAAGVAPAQVTDIFLSHRHPDHVGGLLTKTGAPAFPNARIHLSAPEWEALKRDRAMAGLVAAIAPKVDAFAPGATLLPGVVAAVAAEGHTPGHSAYEIGSGAARLLYIGDCVHHFVVSVQRPEWTVQFDEDPALGRTRRRAMLQRAAEENLRVYAVHFPFPGIGRVQARGESFVWAPEG